MVAESKRYVSGPLDLTSAQGNRSVASPSTLASARMIEDLNAVSYPKSIKPPNPNFTFAVTPGKFRYEREFLLQFRNVCREKPDSLPDLDAIGLVPHKPGTQHAGNKQTGGRRLGSMGMSGAPSLQRQVSVGLGLGPGPANRTGFATGNFGPSSLS
ncbi:eukaryotic translation initiation factor 4G1, eIF4E-binding domain-containing protein [Rhizoctonia solani]|nr:eukaryotic translation initiation factor 4G1, eIF4E-binding domain-containing protein [Rhizoctonia solani]